MQGEIAAAKALQDAGKPGQSLERLRAVQSRVERTGYGPLLLSWTMRVASDEAQVDAAPAAADFEHAVVLAETNRLDKMKTDAFIGLVRHETRSGHYEQARRWLTLASASIARIGGDTRLEALRDIAAGWLDVQEGRTADIRTALRAGDCRRTAETPRRLRHPLCVFGPSTALVALGRFDEGFATYQTAIEWAEQDPGPLHPSITRLFLNNLASDQYRRRSHRGWIDALRRARSHCWRPKCNGERPCRARAILPSPGSRWVRRSCARKRRKRRSYSSVSRATHSRVCSDDLVVVTDNELGEAHRLLGHTAEANVFLNEASAITASPSAANPLLVAATLTVRAKMAMDRKNAAKAIAPAERALALLKLGRPRSSPSPMRASVARVLRARHGDGDRARALAGQARDGFAKLRDQRRVNEATALLEEIR